MIRSMHAAVLATVAALVVPRPAAAADACSLLTPADIAAVVKMPIKRRIVMGPDGCNYMLSGQIGVGVVLQRHLNVDTAQFDAYVRSSRELSPMAPVAGLGEAAFTDGERLLVRAKGALWIFTSNVRIPTADRTAQLLTLARRTLARA
jgi:hypothetical protein